MKPEIISEKTIVSIKKIKRTTIGPHRVYESDISSLTPNNKITDAIIKSYLFSILQNCSLNCLRSKVLDTTFPVAYEIDGLEGVLK